MTIIQKMVRNVLDTQFEDFDYATVDYAKTRIIDTIGALIGGVHSSGVDMVLDLVRQWGGSEESTILAIGDRVPAAHAVLVMGITARSNDYEPSGGAEIKGRVNPAHNSATTVPTAFAMAEKIGMGGKDLITALLVGDDMTSRIGAAAPDAMKFGWEPSGICSRFAATAIAGKLMGLDETQMLNALGIVVNQIASTMQSVLDFTHCYKINQGMAGWNGILSAELAKRGFTGPKDPLTSRFGYFNQFCREVDMEIMTDDLGKIYYQDEGIKLYPACHGNASPVASTLKLLDQNNVEPQEITEVTVDVPPTMKDSFLLQPYTIRDCPQAGAALNLYYSIASVLLRKSVKLEHYTDEALRDPEIFELINKVRVNPTELEKGMTSRVRVKMKDGSELSASTGETRGHVHRSPLTKEEIRDKFISNVAFSNVIALKSAEEAYDMIEKLESLDNITDLVKTLVPASNN